MAQMTSMAREHVKTHSNLLDAFQIMLSVNCFILITRCCCHGYHFHFRAPFHRSSNVTVRWVAGETATVHEQFN
jgi:hypothetical protein